MLKRIFWLALAALVAWLIWMRLRQRPDEFRATSPQFAPPRPFDQFATPAPAHHPDPDEALNNAPEADVPQEPISLDAPEAPPDMAATADARPAASAGEQEDERSPAEGPIAAGGTVTTANENERATAEASNVASPEGVRLLDQEVVGYCMRCKTKRTIKDAHEETTESGRRAARGTCSVCGANLFTFLKDESGD